MASFLGYDFSERTIDLSNQDLKGSDFTASYNFGNISFGNSDISGCRFDFANLEGADFAGKDLTGCSFQGCENIEKANFEKATGLETCNFKETSWADKTDFSDVTGIDAKNTTSNVDSNENEEIISKENIQDGIPLEAATDNYEANNEKIANTSTDNESSSFVTTDNSFLSDRINEAESQIRNEIGQDLEVLSDNEILDSIKSVIENSSLHIDNHRDTLDDSELLSRHGYLAAMRNVLSDDTISDRIGKENIANIINKINDVETKYLEIESQRGIFSSESTSVTNDTNDFKEHPKAALYVDGFEKKMNFNTLCDFVGVSDKNESIHRFGTSNTYAKNGSVDRNVEVKLIPEKANDSVLTRFAVGKIDIGNNKELLFIGNIATNNNGKLEPKIENIHFLGTDGTDKRIPKHLKDENGACTSINLLKSEIMPFFPKGNNFDGKIDINASYDCLTTNLINNSSIQEIKNNQGDLYIRNDEVENFRNSCINLTANLELAIEQLQYKLDSILKSEMYESKSEEIHVLCNNITTLCNDKKEISQIADKMNSIYTKIERLNETGERLLKCENPEQICTEVALYLNDMSSIRNEVGISYNRYEEFIDNMKEEKDIGDGISSKEHYIQNILSEYVDKYNEILRNEIDRDDEIGAEQKDFSYEARALHIGENGIICDGRGIDSVGICHSEEIRLSDDNIARDYIEAYNDPLVNDIKGRLLSECSYTENALLTMAGQYSMLLEAEACYVNNLIEKDGLSKEDAYEKLNEVRSKYFDNNEEISTEEWGERYKGFLNELSSDKSTEIVKDVDANISAEKDDKISIKDKAKEIYKASSEYITIQKKVMGRLSHGDVFIVGMGAVQALAGLIAGEEKYHIKTASGEEKIGYYSVADVISSTYFVLTASPQSISNALMYRALTYVCTRTIDKAIMKLMGNDNDKVDSGIDRVVNSNDFIEDGSFDNKQDNINVIDTNADNNSESIESNSDGTDDIVQQNNEGLVNEEEQIFDSDVALDKDAEESRADIINESIESKLSEDVENNDEETDVFIEAEEIFDEYSLDTDVYEDVDKYNAFDDENDNIDVNTEELYNDTENNIYDDIETNNVDIDSDSIEYTNDIDNDVTKAEELSNSLIDVENNIEYEEHDITDEHFENEYPDDIIKNNEPDDIMENVINEFDNVPDSTEVTNIDTNDLEDTDITNQNIASADLPDGSIDNQQMEAENIDIKEEQTDMINKEELSTRIESVLNADLSIEEASLSDFFNEDTDISLETITDVLSEKLNNISEELDISELVTDVADLIINISNPANFDVPPTSIETFQDMLAKKIKDKDTEDKLYDAVSSLLEVQSDSLATNDVSEPVDNEGEKNRQELEIKFDDREYDIITGDEPIVMIDGIEIENDVDLLNDSIERATNSVIDDVQPIVSATIEPEPVENIIKESLSNNDSIESKDDLINSLEDLKESIPKVLQYLDLSSDPAEKVQKFIEDKIKDAVIDVVNNAIKDVTGIDIKGSIDELKHDIANNLMDNISKIFSQNDIESTDNDSAKNYKNDIDNYEQVDNSSFNDSINDITGNSETSSIDSILPDSGFSMEAMSEGFAEELSEEIVVEIIEECIGG